ncbi:MAG: hypothetical protein HKO53_03120 [Gemmatimonadetes bacterium]|nr:hypothetical protein [Gemmatimonadota bacterium]NNM32026.1 hypothetical protein [Gemmatimonadota bacterium]
MDLLAGAAALALIGLYFYTRKPRRPPQGPLAAAEVPSAEIAPEGLRHAVQSHSRTLAKTFSTVLSNGSPVAFGYSPGHDRVDVFARAGDEGDAFAPFEFSLASMQWLTGPPPDADAIRAVLRDTFPG